MTPAVDGPGAVLARPQDVWREPVTLEVAAVVAAQDPSRAGLPGADARFYDDLGFDSVMLMQLKYRLETRFPELGELSLADMVGSLLSVGTLVEYLADLAEGQPS
ncbi:acyl carrier protein [Kitasatospora mediocidica]|uniref:acyl carrier protein n=1 Tax=Kitasatospora mediocidica TaxID=58352 RepID=UPI00055E2F23|nr:phosphopantetheine-binding protein [Kitasatospora mediocidica]